MGNTPSALSQIEILAPPAAVQSVLLNFSQYKTWQQGWEVTPVKPTSTTTAYSPQVGDVLRVSMVGMTFHPTIVEVSPGRFTWDGAFWGLLVGTHHFDYIPSEKNPGGTTFIQSEKFTGPLTFFFRTWNTEPTSSKNWEKFNEALKAEVERQHAGTPSTST